MKTLLVFPTVENAPPGSAKPPLGLMYIAAYLEKFKHEVKIIDMYVHGLSLNDLLKEIEEFKPKVIAFSVLTIYMPAVQRFSKTIKEKYPDVKIVVGHVHPSALPIRTLNEVPEIDFVAVGEGEYITKMLLDELSKNKPNLENVKGLAFRKQGKVILNPPMDRIENIDDIPFPAWHLVDMEKYLSGLSSLKTFSIMTSRGCPAMCTYCDQDAIWKRQIRLRSPEKVIEEIKILKEKYGMESFIIQDDTFTINKERIKKLCKMLIDQNLNMPWEAKGRVNLVDLETLKAMKKAGCELIIYGIESGSQKILNSVKKGINLEQARNAIKWTKEAGIGTGTFWMMGFPEETEEDIKKTFQFAKELNTDFMSTFAVLVPFPGSAIYSEMKKDGLILNENWDSYWKVFETGERQLPSIRTKYISQKRLFELKNQYDYKMEEIKRNQFILRHLKRIPDILKNFMKNPLGFSKRAARYFKTYFLVKKS